MKPTQILNKYFNTANSPEGYTKKSLGDFSKEMKELSKEDKSELVTLAAADMGVTVET